MRVKSKYIVKIFLYYNILNQIIIHKKRLAFLKCKAFKI